MPKFVRENLVNATQKALDALAEFKHLEEYDLTGDEKSRLDTLGAYFYSAHDGIQRFMQHLDERRSSPGAKPIPKPKAPGELFAWDAHEKKAKIKTLKDTMAALEKELEGME